MITRQQGARNTGVGQERAGSRAAWRSAGTISPGRSAR